MELLAAHSEFPIADVNLAVMCGALHDTQEDQGVSTETLRQRFGSAVASGVEALSKNRAIPKNRAMADSLERIRQQPEAVWCVKLADRIVNLASPPSHWTPRKIAMYREEASLILAALGEAHKPLAVRLEKKIKLYPPGA
jgi:(p)ppGpp synthase/HD superfamily hydrolase